MEWNPTEEHLASPLFRCLSTYTPEGPLCSASLPTLGRCELERLAGELPSPGTLGSLYLRQLLREIGFNDERLLKLRIEHKLVQALLLNHYSPHCMPVTFGASRFLEGEAGSHTRTLQAVYDSGFFVKAALGEGSKWTQSADQSAALTANRSTLKQVDSSFKLTDETFIIQRKVEIHREFRVHSFEGDVVPSLTFETSQLSALQPVLHSKAEAFTQRILDALPVGLKKDSLFGWDIAETAEGRYYIIEVNSTGLHQHFKRGFHCSGLFQSQIWGIRNLAHLVTFIERVKNVSVMGAAPPEYDTQYTQFWRLVDAYRNSLTYIRSSASHHGRAARFSHYEPKFMSREASLEQNAFCALVGDALDPLEAA